MNNNHNDLPTIQCQPTPTDAELQAEPDDLDHIPAQAVQI